MAKQQATRPRYRAKFAFSVPREIELTPERVNKALRAIRTMFNSGHFVEDVAANRKGMTGAKLFNMGYVCTDGIYKCGTVGCIGGWTAVHLLDWHDDATTNSPNEESVASRLFDRLINLDPRLYELFYEYDRTDDHNNPKVAAKAIGRYLTGKKTIWPEGNIFRSKQA
jgi:hypothetical protein